MYVRAHNIGERLFVCKTEPHFATAFQLSLEPIVHDAIAPSVSLLPQFFTLQSAHEHLLPADCVHLIADDPIDTLKHAQTEREERIHSCHFFVDESGANQELRVLRDLVLGRFFTRLCKELRLSHTWAILAHI